jgi:hypothetical protein
MTKRISNPTIKKLAEVINSEEAKKKCLGKNDCIKKCNGDDFPYAAVVEESLLLFMTREEAFQFYKDEYQRLSVSLYERGSKTPMRESLILKELGIPEGPYSAAIWSVTEGRTKKHKLCQKRGLK